MTEKQVEVKKVYVKALSKGFNAVIATVDGGMYTKWMPSESSAEKELKGLAAGMSLSLDYDVKYEEGHVYSNWKSYTVVTEPSDSGIPGGTLDLSVSLGRKIQLKQFESLSIQFGVTYHDIASEKAEKLKDEVLDKFRLWIDHEEARHR